MDNPGVNGAEYKKCPYCGETIKIKAKKCRYCREFLGDVKPAGVPQGVQGPRHVHAPQGVPARPGVQGMQGVPGAQSGHTPQGVQGAQHVHAPQGSHVHQHQNQQPSGVPHQPVPQPQPRVAQSAPSQPASPTAYQAAQPTSTAAQRPIASPQPTVPSPPVQPQPQPQQPQPQRQVNTRTDDFDFDTPKKSNKGLLICALIAVILVAGGIFGYIYYNDVYLPEKIDREAPRNYNITNLFLRSSREAGVEYNKITKLPYGSELITYEKGPEWSRVKVKGADKNSPDLVGYVKSEYIFPREDFQLLQSIWGDNESKETIATTKCRIALLNYYKDKGYYGKVPYDKADSLRTDEQWQVFIHSQQKPNEVYFKRLIRKDSKFTDFAVIIKNIKDGRRKLLYFYFDDDETPHFYGDSNLDTDGYIKDMRLDRSGGLSYSIGY